MKLLKLSCDQPSYKTLQFNSEGLTLIVGDGSNINFSEGSSNGVGKTLSLGLVHHCLGAQVNPKIVAAVPDWMFRLDFSIGGNAHVIERNGKGNQIYLDEKKVRISDLRKWLNEYGPFNLEKKIEGLSFRSLFSRFARLRHSDCIDPIKTSSETPYDALMRSGFLLGIDSTLIVSKKQRKLDLTSIKTSEKNWKGDKVLHDMFRAGSKPKVRAEWLEKEINRIKADLDAFQIAEDYRQIELNAGSLTLNSVKSKQTKRSFVFR